MVVVEPIDGRRRGVLMMGAASASLQAVTYSRFTLPSGPRGVGHLEIPREDRPGKQLSRHRVGEFDRLMECRCLMVCQIEMLGQRGGQGGDRRLYAQRIKANLRTTNGS